MKTTRFLSPDLGRFQHAATNSLIITFALASIAVARPPEGKGGGNGGGDGGGDDGGGDPVTINPVPAVVGPPVTYTSIAFRWENADEFNNPDFQGIAVNSVNSSGLAVGFVKLPAPQGLPGIRLGAINLGAAGEPTDTMVDLNKQFATALADLNASRTNGPWRIAYARKINEAGQIACQLLPAAAPMIDRETVPILVAVANLETLELIPVDPDSTRFETDILDMNEFGDVLVWDGRRDDGLIYNRLYAFDASTREYFETDVPDFTGYIPNFNSSLQLSRSDRVSSGRKSSRSTVGIYNVPTGTESILWESQDGQSLFNFGLAEDGSLYTNLSYSITTGKGKSQTTEYFSIPHHVISATERTPITDVNARDDNRVRHLSRAKISGEEELVIYLNETTGDFQIYKPNFGARFTVPLPAAEVRYIRVSAPWDNDATSSPNAEMDPAYYGGYIVWFDLEEDDSFMLVPSGAPVPTITTP